MNELKIFPEFNIFYFPNGFRLQTELRKQYAGKWYRWVCARTFEWDNKKAKQSVMFEAMESLMVEIYKILLFGQVDPTLIDATFGNHIFELDEDQSSEEDRIQNKYLKK